MANLLSQYGLKEVMDVTFYDLSTNLPVLFLDTLQVSSIEESAETAETRGGIGNPLLIVWDHSRDITMSIEDALMSPRSFALQHGPLSNVSTEPNTEWTSSSEIFGYSEYITADSAYTTAAAIVSKYGSYFKVGTYNVISDISATASSATIVTVATNGKFAEHDLTIMADDGTFVTALSEGERYVITYYKKVDTVKTLTINADTFPGTYRMVGDTLIRSYETGKDELFRVEIPKAKITIENSYTFEAGGDPSTFAFNLRALRGGETGNELIKFVKYNFQ